MTHLGLVFHYLDMSIIQTKDFVSLDQKSYLKKVFLGFGMDIYKLASLPMDSRVPNSMSPTSENQQADKDTIFGIELLLAR